MPPSHVLLAKGAGRRILVLASVVALTAGGLSYVLLQRGPTTHLARFPGPVNGVVVKYPDEWQTTLQQAEQEASFTLIVPNSADANGGEYDDCIRGT
jgi:hypothetical protein